MIDRVRINKESQYEALVDSIYPRKLAVAQYPELFRDSGLTDLFDRIIYRNTKTEFKDVKISAIMDATRQSVFMTVCREYLSVHPTACVVNLGAGLDTLFRQIDNGTASFYNVDFPDVIDARNEIFPAAKNETNIAANILDYTWMDKIDYQPENGILFIAPNLFYNWKDGDVAQCLATVSERFYNAKFVFDATNQKGHAFLRKYVKSPTVDRTDFFSVENEDSIQSISPNFRKVSIGKLMSGYVALNPDFGFINNLFFRYIDLCGYTKLVEISF